MNAVRKRKIIRIGCLIGVIAIAVALVTYALRQNINLFYSPSQVVTGEAPQKQAIRVGGMVVKGSVVRESNLNIRFLITDNANTIEVSYRGILPDLFREGQGIVAQGSVLDAHHVTATDVLAKHDENYMPPEVKSVMIKTREKG